MKKAYAYIRMSTDIQKKGDSLRRQKANIQHVANELGLTLQKDGFYEDIGVSAFKGEQKAGAFKRIENDLASGKIEKGSYLLVESLDRLSREQILNALTQLLTLIQSGVVVVTTIDRQEYSKETLGGGTALYPLMLSLTIMARAHEESLTKSHRIRAAWKNKRKNIATKKLTSVAPAWLKIGADKSHFEIIESRVELVRKIFEDTCNGIGAIKITRSLNSSMVPTWGRSEFWNISYIKKILDNRAVIGELQPFEVVDGVKKALEPITDYYPSIVTKEVFYSAKVAKQSRRNRGGPRGKGFSNLFGGMLRCGYCGDPIYFYNKGNPPKGGIYLRCRKAAVAGSCKASLWEYSKFESGFLEFVKELDLGGVINNEKKKEVIDSLRQSRTMVDAQLIEAVAKTENLTRAIGANILVGDLLTNMLNQLMSAGDDVKLLKEKLKKIDSEIEVTKSKIISANEKHEQLVALKDMMATLSGDALFSLRARLSQLLRSVILTVNLYPDGQVTSEMKKARLTKDLQSSGFSKEEAEAYLQERMANESAQPKGSNRQYMVVFQNHAYRFVSTKALISTADGWGELQKEPLPI